MKQIILLLVVTTLFSCRQQPAGNHYASLIKGDWIEQANTSDHFYGHPDYLCFEDSILMGSWSNLFSYRLVNDTIYTKLVPVREWHNDAPPHHYKIVKLTADTLAIQFPQKDTTDQTVIFSKVHPKNNITPTTIYFASTGCFGSCPSMYLEIDSETFAFMDPHLPLKKAVTGANCLPPIMKPSSVRSGTSPLLVCNGNTKRPGQTIQHMVL
jgi:hypothetical protein